MTNPDADWIAIKCKYVSEVVVPIRDDEYTTLWDWILSLLTMFIDISSWNTTVPHEILLIKVRGSSTCFLIKKVKPGFPIFHKSKVRQALILLDCLLVKLDNVNNWGLSITGG